jgi:hypothetical protein
MVEERSTGAPCGNREETRPAVPSGRMTCAEEDSESLEGQGHIKLLNNVGTVEGVVGWECAKTRTSHKRSSVT